MSLFSNSFIIFVMVCLLVYYIVPKRAQWIILLLFSYLYYMASSVPATLFLVFSTLVTYGCALWIQKVERTSEDKKKAKGIARRIIVLGLLLNFGMLGLLKYTNFFITNINLITKGQIDLLNLILPLGISFYTFQSSGYLLDVYWGKAEAEKNPFRFALFVSFFPQLLQGPIGRYSRLAKQLYAEHTFELHNIRFGIERIIWGFFKKMVLADWAGVYKDAIFADPDKFSGLAIIGVLMYSVELYGDFSGGIDVVIGVASMFGITMDENFKRPFFAVSVTDFWHRWHITLGTWMKDYVFYPLSLSKAMRSCGKFGKKVFGKKVGRTIPICVANLIVFFLVGVWHGPEWRFIAYGMYNGIIIAVSGLLAPSYVTVKNKLHINDKSKPWHLFMILRTFILVNISWYFDLAESWGQAAKMLRYSVTQFDPSQLLLISSGKLGTDFTPYALTILGIGVLILFIVGVLQENGIQIRNAINKTPWIIQFVVFMLLFICIPLFGPQAVARGFIYAQF